MTAPWSSSAGSLSRPPGVILFSRFVIIDDPYGSDDLFSKGSTMKNIAPGTIALLLLFALAAPAQTAAPVQAPASATSDADNLAFEEAARFISGLPCESEALRRLQEAKEWKEYAEAIGKAWNDLETKRLKPMREWAAAELTDSRAATRTLFYPFGGPDILTVFELYPDAETYILGGLEPVGKLPDFRTSAPLQAAAYLKTLNGALWDYFNKSYFITKAMSATLAVDKVDGVLPILALFLKRTGNVLVSIKRCEFLDSGEIVEMDFYARKRRAVRPYGVKIEFLPEGGTKPRTLYYFSADLSDGVFRPKSKFFRFANTLSFETTFIKSASYLMHYTFFFAIRNLLLDKSQWILEDDTGIPYRYFKPEIWEDKLYGEYSKPIELFHGVEQEDLKKAYAEPGKARVLPFHLGYHWSTNKDSLLYFHKKVAASPEIR
jgi:hypothetical protein